MEEKFERTGAPTTLRVLLQCDVQGGLSSLRDHRLCDSGLQAWFPVALVQ
jgi:hypothetical protein